MKTASTYNYITKPENLVRVLFDGQDYMLPEGDNLAAALLAAGVRDLRNTPVSAEPRAPFCMMGACFDCLVTIDGATRQACMTEVTDGLEIRRMPSVRGDQND